MIARVSAARPKIADYPFTTLVPNLGMVRLQGERSFVVADMPGLIEGAHRGAGLGDRFLRHLERTRVLIHLLDATAGNGRTPLRDYEALNRELRLYDPRLAERPQIVAINKIDVPEVRAATQDPRGSLQAPRPRAAGGERRHRRGRATTTRSRLANSVGDAESDREFRNVGGRSRLTDRHALRHRREHGLQIAERRARVIVATSAVRIGTLMRTCRSTDVRRRVRSSARRREH